MNTEAFHSPGGAHGRLLVVASDVGLPTRSTWETFIEGWAGPRHRPGSLPCALHQRATGTTVTWGFSTPANATCSCQGHASLILEVYQIAPLWGTHSYSHLRARPQKCTPLEIPRIVHTSRVNVTVNIVGKVWVDAPPMVYSPHRFHLTCQLSGRPRSVLVIVATRTFEKILK
jgi:hypothetical protein